jgi:hypothetical protein
MRYLPAVGTRIAIGRSAKRRTDCVGYFPSGGLGKIRPVLLVSLFFHLGDKLHIGILFTRR